MPNLSACRHTWPQLQPSKWGRLLAVCPGLRVSVPVIRPVGDDAAGEEYFLSWTRTGSSLAVPQASDCSHRCLLSVLLHSCYQRILLGHLQWRGLAQILRPEQHVRQFLCPRSFLPSSSRERKETWKQIKHKRFQMEVVLGRRQGNGQHHDHRGWEGLLGMEWSGGSPRAEGGWLGRPDIRAVPEDARCRKRDQQVQSLG